MLERSRMMGAEFELKLAEEQIAILRESITQLKVENEALRKKTKKLELIIECNQALMQDVY